MPAFYIMRYDSSYWLAAHSAGGPFWGSKKFTYQIRTHTLFNFICLASVYVTGQYANYYPIMASSLPTFPRIVFTIVEPISL
jgi:hypothetical protein